MRKMIMAVIASAGILAATSAPAANHDKERNAKYEAALAKAIEGRVAGKPVDCIQLRDIRSSRIIDDTAIVYDVGRTVYVNRPTSGATFLDSSDILVTDTRSSQLCSIDIVRLLDGSSRMMRGSVGLGKFVPYTKPKV
ncbi:MAG: hypothetical protein ABW184_11180 [Sphingobium sp.]